MKVTRSYWFGLGSGLILSAMLSMVFSPLQGQAEAPEDSSTVTGVQQAPLNPSDSVKPSVATESTQDNQSADQSSISNDRSFVIPKGASAERIADLLVAQGFIKDKETFLVGARHMGVESRFRAGTFNLSAGLTLEELLLRLIKK